ncbi:hypothetical protein AZE42_07184 [Rhizopogon vesiculosus]|uniref:Uncharacterized protein n=1 Tax=Rhizopogon vesiculosus TaxID=180088 RepID=A0A1J8QCJ4_9AGAM|nr:hypothetical protein AZE42_07184 [Rhizopogon vesiculosus]
MHQALFISEILVEIFSHVKDIFESWNPGTELWRESLAVLARMCKAFHDPAMDLLWADMDNLEPLLGCVTRLHPLIYDPEVILHRE